MSLNKTSILYGSSWALILYTLLIIAWGAWVRISGSGDGCGDHWPLCHGSAVPLGAEWRTWVEVSHRYSTALFGILVIAQIAFVRRIMPAGHPARRWVWLTLVFTITEALIGRFLVKEGLVNESQSLHRLVVMPLHLVNTSLLLGSEVVTAESIRFGHSNCPERSMQCSTQRPVHRSLHTYLVAFALLVLLTSGAIAALGSHLMPSESLLEGLQQDLRPDAHPAVRLRVLHPLLGLLIPMGLWLAINYSSANPASSQVIAARKHLLWGLATTVLIGIFTLGFLSPTWLKLSHLTAANLLVVLVVRYGYHSAHSPPPLAASILSPTASY
jgi:cytochrome c oxidase assembly protein subunit 15